MSCQFGFLGHHLYRSTIFLSFCVQFELGQHLYRSVIILSIRVCVLGQHPYRSARFLSFFVFSLSRDRTYIDSSLSCQFEFAFWGCTHIDRPYSYHFVFSLSQGHTYIDHPSSYQLSSTSRVFVQYDIQSHIFSFGVQSRCAYSSRHFESPLFLHFGHLESFSSPGYLVFIACSSCFSRLTLPLHMTQSFEITTSILVMFVRHPTLSILM